MINILINILRVMVLVTGCLDAYKYRFLTMKISRLKSSREISRKFLNASIISRLILLIYVSLVLNDTTLTFVSVIALYTMCEAFYHVYLYYPYRNRGLKNFRRPSVWAYLVNSLRSNKTRKRL